MKELYADIASLSFKQRILFELRLRAMRPGISQPEIRPIDNRSKCVALSFAQQRLWFIAQLEPNNTAYNVPAAVRLRGKLNVTALEQTLSEVIRRHEVLRTIFKEMEGRAVQVIMPAEPVKLFLVDLSEVGEEEREGELMRLAKEEAEQRFDLTQGPLLRVWLLRLGEEDQVVFFTMHHIVSDGWSREVLIREVTELYKAFSEGRVSPLPELPIQYGDYAVWQRDWMRGEVFEEQLNYWKNQLKDLPVLELPTDRTRPAVRSSRGATERLQLSPELSEGLKKLSQQEGVTLFMTLLAGFQVLLSRYSGQREVVVGTDIANRNRHEIEGLIGFFVNQLVLRTDLTGDPSFQVLLGRVREVTLEAYAHQDLPFEKLVEELQPERTLGNHPLFQTKIIFENASEETLELPGLSLNLLETGAGTAKVDLMLLMIDSGQGLISCLEYSTDLFKAATIRRMLGHWERLLEGIVAHPEGPVGELPLMSEAEERQILVEWNDTRVEYGEGKCLHELFEAQVERSAEAIAVTYEGQEVSYGELNRRANQLGHYLQGLGVGPEVRVGLCLERSVELVVGILGILKAGGAYVPLDPDYPQERLAFMLEDSAPAVLLTQGHLQGLFSGISGSMPVLDLADATPPWRGQAESNPERTAMGLTGEHLAYVIYTSGSTGRPKGVMNAHCGVVNRLVWMQRAYGLEPHDAVLQKTPVSFDVSVWEFFCPLMTGARLVMARPNGHKDPGYLVEAMRDDQVTTVHFVPSMLQVFLDHAEAAKHSGLRRVICSGEVLPAKVARCFQERLTSGLHNLYGPTEAAIDVTAWTCPADTTQESIPIGRPVANTQIYILDEHLEAVLVGIAGELHVGGVQVARGYLNRPDLTAERFIPNPYGEEAGGRLYKTGDLGRYQRDGDIEYLGRSDYQVKIRGFRIELGEIEAVLSRHGQVKEAVVIAREDTPGEKRLVAYVTAVEEEAPNAEELREHLKGALPEYMVPSAFVVLEAMPLTANGEVDRKALPAVDFTAQQTRRYEASQGEIEEILSTIWQELLHVERVGRHDNFFELGGDSILSIEIVTRARQASLSLTVTQLFEHQTIAELAGVADWQGLVATPQGVVSGEVVLTPIQRWFFEQEQVDSHHFNQSVLLEVRHALSSDLVAEAVKHLLRQHDALRMRFIREGEEWQQVNLSQE